MAPSMTHRRYSESSDVYSYKTRSLSEELENWFTSLGLYRKFIARNESCIFRAVSDTRFLTQSYYRFVHRDLLEYTEKLCANQFLFFSQQSELNKEKYLEQLKNPLYYKPSPIDLCIISRMYSYNFKLFCKIDEPPVEIISCIRNTTTIMMYTDFESVYDLVYTQERYAALAFCQHIVYEIYYKYVFKLDDIDYAVKKMLCQETSPTRLVPGYSDVIDSEGFCPNLNIDKQVMPLNAVYAKRFEMRAKCANMRRLLDIGITPFPYKVAKALDPDIYRNIEFDVWVEQKRGSRSGLEIWANSRFVPGVKCIVRFPNGEGSICHIQDVLSDTNEVKVYVVKETQGRMMTVPLDWLETLGQNQVVVAYRRYLRGSWAETIEQTVVTQSEIQCGDISSTGGDMEDQKETVSPYVTPVLSSPHKPVRKFKPKLNTNIAIQCLQDNNQNPEPEPEPNRQEQQVPYMEAAPFMLLPPAPPVFQSPWQHLPCYPELVPSPYNTMVDPVEYHTNVNYNYEDPPPPDYVQAYSPPTYDMYNTMTALFSPEVQRNTFTPAFGPEVHNAPPTLFSPELHTASPVFFTEMTPGMYSAPLFCPEQQAFPFPMHPNELGWHMGDPILAEVDPYLVPPPSYAFCQPDMYQPHEILYYTPINQMV
uniref:Bifunctional UDP-N-acetylglucosamine transferase and deubiquitinase ALG13 n=1 Tax=Cacopsylla melanoneura TaxID=428564 RepID=A0A8D9E717_9HEMI